MQRSTLFLFFLLAASGLRGAMPEPAAADKKGALAKPPLPQIKSLTLEPAALTLDGGRDARHVLVQGKTAAGEIVDLTSEATFKSSSTNIEIEAGGEIAPKAPGEAEVMVAAGGLQAK